MKAIVHVGLPKTGTTSIQAWLLENRAALAAAGITYDPMNVPDLPLVESQLEIGFCMFERCGELIPDAATRANYRLEELGRQAELARQYEAIFAAAVEAARAAGHHSFAISSEHLGAWSWHPHHVRALDDWLAGFFETRHYVIYIRRQEDWVLSLYSQHIKNGGTETLDQFIKMYGETNFMHKARIFSETVGRSHFQLRLMDRAAMKDGDLYADYAALFGLEASDFARPGTQNPSLDMANAEFLRLMNDHFQPRVDGNSRRNPLFGEVVEHLEATSKPARKLAMTPEQITRVRKLNEAQNEDLRATYFPDQDQLFPPKEAKPGLSGESPSARELAMVGIQLYRAVRMKEIPPLPDHDIGSILAARKT